MVVQIKSGKRENGKSFWCNLYRKRSTTPESSKGSLRVISSSRQWFSKVKSLSWHAFEWIYPLQHYGVAGGNERSNALPHSSCTMLIRQLSSEKRERARKCTMRVRQLSSEKHGAHESTFEWKITFHQTTPDHRCKFHTRRFALEVFCGTNNTILRPARAPVPGLLAWIPGENLI